MAKLGAFPDDNGWGHAIHCRKRLSDTKFSVHGWLTPLPQIGDTFRQHMHSTRKTGKCAVMKFTEVRSCGDPRDMFFGEVEFIEYAI